MLRITKPTLALLALAFAAACTSDEAPPAAKPEAATPPAAKTGGSIRPIELVLGLTPYQPDEELRTRYAGLIAHLGKKIGLPVKLLITESYESLSEAVAKGEVHVAVLPPFAYVNAKKQMPTIQLLASEIIAGAPTYTGYIVVRGDGEVKDLEGLQGRHFAFVDKQSASGYLYAMAHLKQAGFAADELLAKTTFTGSHDDSLRMVISGEVDAAAVYSRAYSEMRRNNQEARYLEILAKTGTIPHGAYCATSELNTDLVAKLRAALLALNTRTAEGREVLSGLSGVNGFHEVKDSHWDDVRRVAATLEAKADAQPKQ